MKKVFEIHRPWIMVLYYLPGHQVVDRKVYYDFLYHLNRLELLVHYHVLKHFSPDPIPRILHNFQQGHNIQLFSMAQLSWRRRYRHVSLVDLRSRWFPKYEFRKNILVFLVWRQLIEILDADAVLVGHPKLHVLHTYPLFTLLGISRPWLGNVVCF